MPGLEPRTRAPHPISSRSRSAASRPFHTTNWSRYSSHSSSNFDSSSPSVAPRAGAADAWEQPPAGAGPEGSSALARRASNAASMLAAAADSRASTSPWRGAEEGRVSSPRTWSSPNASPAAPARRRGPARQSPPPPPPPPRPRSPSCAHHLVEDHLWMLSDHERHQRDPCGVALNLAPCRSRGREQALEQHLRALQARALGGEPRLEAPEERSRSAQRARRLELLCKGVEGLVDRQLAGADATDKHDRARRRGRRRGHRRRGGCGRERGHEPALRKGRGEGARGLALRHELAPQALQAAAARGAAQLLGGGCSGGGALAGRERAAGKGAAVFTGVRMGPRGARPAALLKPCSILSAAHGRTHPDRPLGQHGPPGKCQRCGACRVPGLPRPGISLRAQSKGSPPSRRARRAEAGPATAPAVRRRQRLQRRPRDGCAAGARGAPASRRGAGSCAAGSRRGPRGGGGP
jgi:hypothetical protein